MSKLFSPVETGKIIHTDVLRLGCLVRSQHLQLAAVMALAGTTAGYWPAFAFWWHRWLEADSYYSHGPFVPLASAFVVWFNRRKLAALPVKPSAWGYPVMLIAAASAWFAWMGASASAMGLTLPVSLYGAVVAVLGMSAARVLAFPIFFLYAGAVLPESVLAALSVKSQMFSITLVTAGLNLAGFDAVSKGAYISLPGMTVEVANACSGFRLIVSMIAIAVFFAYIRQGPMWGKLALIMFALPLAVLANSLRIGAVTLVGLYKGETALYTAHDSTGYIVLVTAAAMLLLFARLVRCGRYREMPTA